MKDIRSTIVKYIVTISIGGVIGAIALWARNFSSLTSLAEKYAALEAATTIPGVVLLMLGVLVLISKDGFFDMITYSVGKFAKSLVPFSHKTDESYYDYKVRKSEKRLSGFSCLFVVGGIFTAAGIIFAILNMQAVANNAPTTAIRFIKTYGQWI